MHLAFYLKSFNNRELKAEIVRINTGLKQNYQHIRFQNAKFNEMTALACKSTVTVAQ